MDVLCNKAEFKQERFDSNSPFKRTIYCCFICIGDSGLQSKLARVPKVSTSIGGETLHDSILVLEAKLDLVLFLQNLVESLQAEKINRKSLCAVSYKSCFVANITRIFSVFKRINYWVLTPVLHRHGKTSRPNWRMINQ